MENSTNTQNTKSKQRGFVIRRSIKDPQTNVTIRTLNSGITILQDEQGATLPHIEAALLSKPTTESIFFELDGEHFDTNSVKFVGFSDEFPSETTIAAFMKGIGCSVEESEQLINDYDLSDLNYLTCAQLPATARRQLHLLAALKSDAKLIITKDPFLPFNGRWRETFAKLLLEKTNNGTSIVIFNLSFAPQAWYGTNRILAIDVGKITQEAIDKSLNKDKKEDTQEAKEVTFAYQGVYDYLFEPLANLATFTRTYSAPLMMLGGASLIVLLVLVVYPALQDNNQSFARQLGDRQRVSSQLGIPETSISQNIEVKQKVELATVEYVPDGAMCFEGYTSLTN